MKKAVIVLSVFIVLILAFSPEAYAQCAMCRGSVESQIGNGRDSAGIGLNTGIVYLFIIPYLAVATIAFLWYRGSKKAQAERILASRRISRALDSL